MLLIVGTLCTDWCFPNHPVSNDIKVAGEWRLAISLTRMLLGYHNTSCWSFQCGGRPRFSILLVMISYTDHLQVMLEYKSLQPCPTPNQINWWNSCGHGELRGEYHHSKSLFAPFCGRKWIRRKYLWTLMNNKNIETRYKRDALHLLSLTSKLVFKVGVFELLEAVTNC
jgi:hypothetical protein